MRAPRSFRPGELVLRRHFQRDLLSRVWVGRVAADDEHGLWIWVATGSAHRDLGAADGRHLRDLPTSPSGRACRRRSIRGRGAATC